jgi:hypothetical protein
LKVFSLMLISYTHFYERGKAWNGDPPTSSPTSCASPVQAPFKLAAADIRSAFPPPAASLVIPAYSHPGDVLQMTPLNLISGVFQNVAHI